MMIHTSCSWCHYMNPGGTTYCAKCGHRADVARMDCDCRACRLQKGTPTKEDLAFLRDAYKKLGGQE